jgi:hypothetical protein
MKSFDTLEELVASGSVGVQRQIESDARKALSAEGVETGKTTIWAVVEDEKERSVVRVAEYDAADIYRYSQAPVIEFNRDVRDVIRHLEQMKTLSPQDVEFELQATYFWSKLRKTKKFIAVSPLHGELITTFDQIARIRERTPLKPSDVAMLLEAFEGLKHHIALSEQAVEQFYDRLEAGGFDPSPALGTLKIS